MPKRPWPKLTETLTGPRTPEHCQACGLHSPGGGGLVTWREHDDADAPTHALLVLCHSCGERLIEKHPRLYSDLHRNAPAPGAMALCVGCRHRDGVRCANPAALVNGGTGITITAHRPQTVLLDGTKGGRRVGWSETWYAAPPSACSGREATS